MSSKYGTYCSSKNCNNTTVKYKGLSFFRFPKDPTRCEEWIIKSGRTELLAAPNFAVYCYKNLKLCSEHFKDSMFKNPKHNRLHIDAVPELFQENKFLPPVTDALSPNDGLPPNKSFLDAFKSKFNITSPTNQPNKNPNQQNTSIKTFEIEDPCSSDAYEADTFNEIGSVTEEDPLYNDPGLAPDDTNKDSEQINKETTEKNVTDLATTISKNVVFFMKKNSQHFAVIIPRHINLQATCRTCLGTNDLESIYNLSTEENKTYRDMLQSLISIQVSKEDELPEFICINCIKDLTKLYSFTNRCRQSETTLKCYIEYTKQDYYKRNNVNVDYSDTITAIHNNKNALITNNTIGLPSTSTPIEERTVATEDNICIKKEKYNEDSNSTQNQKKLKSDTRTKFKIPCRSAKNKIDDTFIDDYESYDDNIENITEINTEFDIQDDLEFKFDPDTTIDNFYDDHCYTTKIENLRHDNINDSSNTTATDNTYHAEGDSDSSVLYKILNMEPKPIVKTNERKSNKPHKTESAILTQSITYGNNITTKIYPCNRCSKVFTSLIERCMHRKKEHKRKRPKKIPKSRPTGPFICDVCDKQFLKSYALKVHKRIHGDKKYLCPECGKLFTESSALAVHVRMHKGDYKFPCTVCEKKFLTKMKLISHMRIHTNERPYLCAKCGAAYKDRNTLTKHEQRIHENNLNCKKCVTGQCKKHREKDFGGRSRECTTCGKVFHKRTDFASHRLLECNSLVQCEYCDNKFKSRHLLWNHIQTHRQQFACMFCKEAFLVKKCLDIHILTHADDNHIQKLGVEYACPICEEKFTELPILKDHEETHTVKDYVCENCNKVFHSTHMFMQHVYNEHLQKPFWCKTCDKNFRTYGGLRVHRRKHLPVQHHFKCKYCDRIFVTKYQLVNHVRIHTGEKPHKCSICDHRFARGSNLIAHMRRHTGYRPYVCSVCHASFYDSNEMHQHMRRRHPSNKC